MASNPYYHTKWTPDNYPESMKHLPEIVRNKAIEIGNRLVEEDRLEEDVAASTAINRAQDWAENRELELETRSPYRIETLHHGNDLTIVPYEKDSWAILNEGNHRIIKVFDDKQDAIAEAHAKVKADHTVLTITSRNGDIEKSISYRELKPG